MTRQEETALMMAVVWIGNAVKNIQLERMRDVQTTGTIWCHDDQETLSDWLHKLGAATMKRDPYNERVDKRR